MMRTLVLLALPVFGWIPAMEPLKICCTVPDLGSLAREVGGEQVSVTVFSKGSEDPHFLEAKPSFIKALNQADLLVFVGMDLEAGYLPTLVQNARNARVLPGAPGHVDASAAVKPLELPTGTLDRSMGDVHPLGNPHYLLDPLRALQVAALLRDRFGAARPESKAFFDGRYEAFRTRLGKALVGEALYEKYPAEFEKLALLHEKGALGAFLEKHAAGLKPGGWIGALFGIHGTKVVADHNLWPYLAERHGLRVVAFLEPKPGISPTTKQLQQIVTLIKAEGIRVILTSPYYDPCFAKTVSDATGARAVLLAHQVGSREGADDYLTMIDGNVKALAAAFAVR